MRKRRRVIGWSMNEISEGVSIVLVRNDHYYRCYLPSESSIKRYKTAIRNIFTSVVCHFCDEAATRPCPHCGVPICMYHIYAYHFQCPDEDVIFCPECYKEHVGEH